MSIYDIGDVVTLSATIHDIDGDPVDAGTVVCTITLPDGSTTQPPVAHTAAGDYSAQLVCTMVGLHVVRWVAAGANAGAFTTDFFVTPGLVIVTPEQVCAKQRVAVPTAGSIEAAALAEAVAAAPGLVLGYLQRESIDGLRPAGVAAVRAVAVRLAARLWRNPADAASESYGEQSISWVDPRVLTGDEQMILNPYRARKRGPIVLTPRYGGDVA